MIASTMDTAELPRSGTEAPVEPVETLRAGADDGPSPAALAQTAVLLASLADPVPPPAVAGRRALREGRRQQRRQQRRYAAAGVSVLAVVFLMAVIVLGGIR